ncbi:MAG: dynamin family protein [Desulfobacca sp.]|uniref:dynamin family protein n=1 Tax=Desulfobacca sp. TaxID=2067990 RepID=UPI00404A5A61
MTGIQSLINGVAAVVPVGVGQTENWRLILANLENKAAAGRFRVAVVGTVKSGKSTLINALLGRDVLKRGAGIVTAMITRIEPGESPRALLDFKSWEEVNGELNSALSLFPSPILLERREGYDIRQTTDRTLLLEALGQIDPAQLLNADMMDTNYLLVHSFLTGYSDVEKMLAGGQPHLELAGPELERHQQLVTHDAKAVYLKDVRLFLPFPWSAQGLELGDCQGSDSPIPQHLAQVHNYLLGTDLVIYVVSARIGLRQADYKFLAELKRLHLLDNCVFILNLDLNEVENLAEAQQLQQRWQREITAFQAGAPLFAFSALDLLLGRLRARGEALSPKDLGKLLTWEGDAALTAYSRQEAARFEAYLQQTLTTKQNDLLLASSVGHLSLLIQGIRERLLLQDKLVQEDAAALQDSMARLGQRRQSLERLLHSLDQALQGAVADLKKRLRRQLDSFFDARQGAVGPLISQFIQDDSGDLERLELGGHLSAFLPGLYLVYQGFQQRLLRFLTEEVNLKIMEFIYLQEEWLQEELTQVLAPLLASLQDALNLYYQEIAALGISAAAPTIALTPWQKPEKLQPHLFSLELGLTMRLRSQAMLRFGINLVADAVRRLRKRLRQQTTTPAPDRLRASLAKALDDIKAHTRQEMADSLLSYCENLKFQYFFPLAEYLASEQGRGLHLTLAGLLVDLESLQGVISQQSQQRQVWRRRLEDLTHQLQEVEATCLQPLTNLLPASATSS